MKTVLTTTQHVIRQQMPKATMTATQKIETALKELLYKFSNIVEIGKFKPIKTDIQNPLKDSVIQKASIVIEPLADKNDFRTRTISFIAYSPFDSDKIHEITIATGNKFAIESALKNTATKAAFKNFIKSAENVLA